MPEPVGKFALLRGYRWIQVSAIEPSHPFYDKQALIDLLEAAASECIKYGEDSGDLQWMADHLRKLKETL